MERNFEYEEMIEKKEELEMTWSAGQQIKALKYYLKPRVKVIREYNEGGYQGECYVLLKYKEKYILWRDSFGSCSGCDSLDGCNENDGYNYIKSTMTEGNCKTFQTIKAMKNWLLNDTTDCFWHILREEYRNFKSPEVK